VTLFFFFFGVCVYVWLCNREREREREVVYQHNKCIDGSLTTYVCFHVSLCVLVYVYDVIIHVALCKDLPVTTRTFPHITTFLFLSVVLNLGMHKVKDTYMLTLEDIRKWWERKINNYIKNYARRNRLTIA
jgi:hypothetical protein